MREAFDVDLVRLEDRLAVISREIETLVRWSRGALPAKRRGSLYLALKRHTPPCAGCPHGPYWFSAWMGPDRRWRGTYLGVRLSKGRIRQSDHWGNFRLLEELDRRASELRKEKKSILMALRKIRSILVKSEQGRRD